MTIGAVWPGLPRHDSRGAAPPLRPTGRTARAVARSGRHPGRASAVRGGGHLAHTLPAVGAAGAWAPVRSRSRWQNELAPQRRRSRTAIHGDVRRYSSSNAARSPLATSRTRCSSSSSPDVFLTDLTPARRQAWTPGFPSDVTPVTCGVPGSPALSEVRDLAPGPPRCARRAPPARARGSPATVIRHHRGGSLNGMQEVRTAEGSAAPAAATSRMSHEPYEASAARAVQGSRAAVGSPDPLRSGR